MTESVYRKTALPARLDLNKRNTREQLSQATDDRRGCLEGVGVAVANAGATSRKDCTDVMRKDLQTWLVEHGITGPPPSAEAEQRAMWAWIRDFHKEYNDDWYARNMPRLRDQFRPVFVQEMKSMKEKLAPAPAPSQAASAGGADLLDFAGPAPAKETKPAATASGGQDDLLGFDVSPAPAPATAAAAAPVDLTAGVDIFAAPSQGLPAASPAAAPSSNPLEDVLGGSIPSPAPATSAAVGLADVLGGLGTTVPSAAVGDGLLNLDLGSFASPAQPSAANAGYTAAPAPTSQAAMLEQLQQQLSQPSPQQQLPTLQQTSLANLPTSGALTGVAGPAPAQKKSDPFDFNLL
eukprot:gb/GFBE01080877.1/.p1 GENE.gb/GFBE01080877.1/~~gb/GFBE01080877.1/.p1  ORF type:complete len:350 (+),score=61.93 gb/GFBE01080877.1/:1-1050(+)